MKDELEKELKTFTKSLGAHNYSVNFNVMDLKDGKRILSVGDNVAKQISQFRYDKIEEQLLVNMPDDVLEDLRNKVLKEYEERKAKGFL